MLAHQEDRLPSTDQRIDQPEQRRDNRGSGTAHMRYTDPNFNPKRPYLRIHPDCQDLLDNFVNNAIEFAIDVTHDCTRLQVSDYDFHDAMGQIKEWGHRDFRGTYTRG